MPYMSHSQELKAIYLFYALITQAQTNHRILKLMARMEKMKF